MPTTDDGHVIMEWRGQAVPWTTAWSGETEPRLFVTRDGRALPSCIQAPGVGVPKFTVNHPTRHAKAIVGRLCSVCGTPMAEDWVWCVPMDLRTGAQSDLLAEPATHEDCLRFSCTACPALVRRRPPIWRLRGWQTHYLPISQLAGAEAVLATTPKELVPRLASTVAYVPEGPVRACTYEDFLGRSGEYLVVTS